MYVITCTQQYNRKCDPEFRVLAIFKDESVAKREKRYLEKNIEQVWKSVDIENDDQTIYDKNSFHWICVRQLDEDFDPEYESTSYSVSRVKVTTRLGEI